MIRTLTISGQPVEVNSSAGWFYVYKEQFGHDIMPDLMPILEGVLGSLAELAEDSNVNLDEIELYLTDDIVSKLMDALSMLEVTTIYNIIWAMAKNASDSIEQPRQWVNKFDVFEVDVILPEIVKLVAKSSISSKNWTSLLEKLRKAKEKLPSISQQ